MNQTFPFVTIPDFPQKAAEILSSSQPPAQSNNRFIELVGLAPVVYPEQFEAWSNYSVQQQGWIEEYRSMQASRFPPPDPIATTIALGSTKTTTPSSTESSLSSSSLLFALPLWQMFPVTDETAERVNTDLVTNATPVVSRALVRGVGQQQNVLTSLETSSVLATPCPRCSLLTEPIFVATTTSSSSSSSSRAGGEVTRREVGAIVWAWLSWDALFTGHLPVETGRMMIEVENDCDVQLSYAVKGPASGFVGVGRLHDEQFDDLAVRFYPFGNESSTSECPFAVTAYPTVQFKNLYVTDAPWVYSGAVICVFFFAASVFACYDQSLHRKQEKLLEAAQKTSAIVAEIFPKNVQKRIIEEKEQRSSMHASRSSGLAPKSELKNLIGRDEKNNTENYKGKPIADLFPEVTIMFADIVGFTAWSSTREPSQVFTLLEGLYAEFDRIAAKRRVFKVRTVQKLAVNIPRNYMVKLTSRRHRLKRLGIVTWPLLDCPIRGKTMPLSCQSLHVIASTNLKAKPEKWKLNWDQTQVSNIS